MLVNIEAPTTIKNQFAKQNNEIFKSLDGKTPDEIMAWVETNTLTLPDVRDVLILVLLHLFGVGTDTTSSIISGSTNK